MKPFDLQKAIDGHPLITRGGKPATDFVFFRNAIDAKSKCMAVVNGDIIPYFEDGTFLDSSLDSNIDLFLAPIKQERWINIYRDKNGEYPVMHSNEDHAKEKANSHGFAVKHLVTVRVSWEE